MEKVYIVVENITTDEIVKVFANKEKAEAFAYTYQAEMNEKGWDDLVTCVIEMEVE